MTNSADKYRHKAFACEKLGREAGDAETRAAWVEIAIEWHALASRMEREFGAAGLTNQSKAMPQLAQ
jgi:hypothetical protein